MDCAPHNRPLLSVKSGCRKRLCWAAAGYRQPLSAVRDNYPAVPGMCLSVRHSLVARAQTGVSKSPRLSRDPRAGLRASSHVGPVARNTSQRTGKPSKLLASSKEFGRNSLFPSLLLNSWIQFLSVFLQLLSSCLSLKKTLSRKSSYFKGSQTS